MKEFINIFERNDHMSSFFSVGRCGDLVLRDRLFAPNTGFQIPREHSVLSAMRHHSTMIFGGSDIENTHKSTSSFRTFKARMVRAHIRSRFKMLGSEGDT
jgi:hypothetical protein